MRVVVCEDDKITLDMLEGLILNVAEQNQLAITVDGYASGEALLENLAHAVQSDVAVLDIKMGKLTGMEAAKLLRENGFAGKLLFVTSVLEAAPQGFELNAFRFILKDKQLERNFRRCLQEAVDAYLLPRQVLCLNTHHSICEILVQEIIYIENTLRKVVVHTKAPLQNNEFYAKMNDLEAQLQGNGFLRCHNSYLVNPAYVTELAQQRITLVGGRQLPVSKRRYTEVRRQLLCWRGTRHA